MKDLLKKAVSVLVLGLALCAVWPQAAVRAKDIVIVLDPGHGCSETGAFRTWNKVTYREEVFNLKIANYAKEELEKYEGVKVYLTHNSLEGSFMDRKQRLQVAKNKKAAALVSIHINSTEDKKTSRTGAYAVVPSVEKYPDSKSYAKKSRALSRTILRELNTQTGLKNNGYWIDDGLGIILYGMKYKIPSMIIEHCFINNPNDCKKYLKTEAQLKKMAVADATGIAEYFNLERKDGSDVDAAPVKNGWYKENGGRCYYNEGVKYKNGWKKIDGKYYYFTKTGVLKTGVFKIGGKLYLSNSKGVRQKGFVTYAGKKYYADKKGKLYTGWQKYKGKKYYFRPKDGRMLKSKWLKWKGKWYYLGSNGKAYTSTKKKIGKKWYKFNSKGICTNRV